MTTAKKLLSTQTGGDKLYVDDVFSTYLYTGNGSTQTINNGIDLAGEGGLVWLKARTNATNNVLQHTANEYLISNLTNAASSTTIPVSSLNSNGFSLSSANWGNGTGVNFVSWTFRNAPKVFDVVTYTGNGVAGRQIPHELGIAPGMVIIKATSISNSWVVYHKSLGVNGGLHLNETITNNGFSGLTSVDEAAISLVGNDTAANGTGIQYVAYLWAHDDSEDGMIQCGSTTGNSTVNLGWEPQFVLLKSTTSASQWVFSDSMRGMNADLPTGASLNPNSSGSESGACYSSPTATGFRTDATFGSNTLIYLAIRRPNKPPTSGTEVYNAIARTGTGVAATVTGVGFAPDFAVVRDRAVALWSWRSRLTGVTNRLRSDSTVAEVAAAPGVTFDAMDGVRFSDGNGEVNGELTYINHFFKRATGFMDVVCDTGTGAAHAITHNLTKAPELIIRKSRSAATQWECWHSALSATEKLVLNSTAGKVTDATAFGTLPTATTFYVGASSNTNASAATYVTYLFATCPGVSKVGYYTGNGASLSVECGFSAGARFILVKSIDAAGDWFVWDTARGIVAANDPYLSLNRTAVEVTTDDSVDPYSGGFIVNQVAATNINITGKRYIFLAIA